MNIQIPLTEIPSSKRFSAIELLQLIILVSLILYFGQTLLIPLSFAFLISFILYPFCSWMEKKGLNKSLSITISITLLIIISAAVVFLLIKQFSSFLAEWQSLKLKLFDTLTQIGIMLENEMNISSIDQRNWLKDMIGKSGSQLIPFFGSTIYTFSVLMVFIFIVPVLSALILYYRKILFNVLCLLFPQNKRKDIREILHETIHTYYKFIRGMGMVYLIVGVLNSIGLAIIGIPHAILFGFIASILTFIPYIGIMVGSLLPLTIAWLTYNSIWYPLGVIFVFGLVQYLEANVIFPIAVSGNMNLNTLATIIVIIAGGILWGAAGMILFVPFLGILKLIADRTESLKIVSIILGTTNKPGST
jgi:predicted PurR-regulated permease PerM